MTHDQAYELLPELLELRIAHAAEPELRAHVDVCAMCTTRLRELQRVDRALRAARDAHGISLAQLEERVLSIPVREPRRPVSRLRRRLLPAGVAVAAAASIAALAIALTGPDIATPPAGFEAQETVALRPVNGKAAGTVEFGRPSGATRVVRLKIRGLPMKGARTFDLWLITGSGAVRVGSFGPDRDGSCIVDLTAPSGERWERIAITPTGSGPDERVIALS